MNMSENSQDMWSASENGRWGGVGEDRSSDKGQNCNNDLRADFEIRGP